MKINYGTHLVGFLDVMGFKELLADNKKNREKLGKYFEHIQLTQDLEKILGTGELQIIAVSDSIVYAVELPEELDDQLEIAANFFKTLTTLQYHLAAQICVWTRGGVSVGNLHVDADRNFIVGQAFVDALNLEEAANYPRIILDPKIFSHFNKTPHEFTALMRGKYNAPIMDFAYDNPISLPPWSNDFVQLDWFGWGLDFSESNEYKALEKISGSTGTDKSMAEFFNDLLMRQSMNANLFLKTQLLLRYFLQSRYQYHARKGDPEKPYVVELTKKLASLTGIDMTNPPAVIIA